MKTKPMWMLSATLALGLALALGLGAALAQTPSPTATLQQTPVGTSFTYQGKLIKDGSPVTDTCNFVFSLWDAWSGGTQFGGDSLNLNVPVNEGLFTADVNFWPGAFTGEARWLEIEVRCTGDADSTTLSPRQELTAAPYAHGLALPYTGALSTTVGTDLFVLQNAEGRALQATSGKDTAIWAWSSGPIGLDARSGATNGRGVVGLATDTTGANYGLFGQSDSTAGRGVYGYATATTGGNYGVHGQSDSNLGIGVLGEASAGSGETYGVLGQAASTMGTGVWGWATASSGATYGVLGQSLSTAGYGLYGLASASDGTTYGVYGRSDAINGRGVFGYASSTPSIGRQYGVYGQVDSTRGYGVYGLATATTGQPAGVYGVSNAFEGYGVYGQNTVGGGFAGWFDGNVNVIGTLWKSAGSFRIDHPLDPAGKYLYHSFVESPDMMNIYNGVIVLDENGAAWVELPAWFEALNKDYRYQLTPIGAPAPDLYIAQEIQDNRFQIAGGTPELKVSWQVTGIRQDPYAEAYRIPVEQNKPAHEQGSYLHPELYGQPEERGMDILRNEHLPGTRP